MKVTTKGKTIIVKHKLRKDECYKISKGTNSCNFVIYKRPILVRGFSNVCEDNMQILTIDYDNVDINVVKEDFTTLQNQYALPQAYLFKTNKGYHLVCIKKMSSREVNEIIKSTRCDINYMSMPLRNVHRSYILRISNKGHKSRPKYIELLGHDKFKSQILSNAHFILLSKLYKNLPKIKGSYDRLNNVRIQIYETNA